MKILLVHSGNAVSDSSDYTFVKEQGDALQNIGHDVFYFAIKGKGLKGYLGNRKRLVHTIISIDPDIIHAHYGLSGALAILQKKAPVVITFHNGETLTMLGRIISSIASWFSNYNIYVAEHIRKNLFWQHGKYSILPCGIWLDKLPIVPHKEAVAALNFDPDTPNILFGGAFDNARKNHPLARQAVSLAANRANLIEMKGWDREQVPVLLSACDLLLLPTLSEGSPQVVKEAMACNCPVVATDVADIKWLLDGVTNSFVTGFDANEIAKCIDTIITSGNRSNGRDKIKVLGLDNKSVAINLDKIYARVISNKH